MSASTISNVVATWLRENRPEDLDEVLPDTAIRAMDDRTAKARPQLVVLVEAGPRPHPKLPHYQVTLHAEWIPAEDGADDFRAAVLEMAGLLPAEFQSVRHDLAQERLLLRKMVRGTEEETVEGETGRRLQVPFTFIVQTELV